MVRCCFLVALVLAVMWYACSALPINQEGVKTKKSVTSIVVEVGNDFKIKSPLNCPTGYHVHWKSTNQEKIVKHFSETLNIDKLVLMHELERATKCPEHLVKEVVPVNESVSDEQFQTVVNRTAGLYTTENAAIVVKNASLYFGDIFVVECSRDEGDERTGQDKVPEEPKEEAEQHEGQGVVEESQRSVPSAEKEARLPGQHVDSGNPQRASTNITGIADQDPVEGRSEGDEQPVSGRPSSNGDQGEMKNLSQGPVGSEDSKRPVGSEDSSKDLTAKIDDGTDKYDKVEESFENIDNMAAVVYTIVYDQFMCGSQENDSSTGDVKPVVVLYCSVVVGGFWKPRLVFRDLTTGSEIAGTSRTITCGKVANPTPGLAEVDILCARNMLTHNLTHAYTCEQAYHIENRTEDQDMSRKSTNIPQANFMNCNASEIVLRPLLEHFANFNELVRAEETLHEVLRNVESRSPALVMNMTLLLLLLLAVHSLVGECSIIIGQKHIVA